MQTCRSQFIIWSHSYFVAFSIHIIYCILAWYFTCLFLDFDKVKLIQSLINQSIQRSCDQFFTDQLLLIVVIMWPVLHRPVTAHRGDHVTSTSQTSYCSDRWSCDQHFLMVETGYCTEPMLCRTEREKRTLQEQHAVNTYPEQLKNRDHTCTCNTEAVPADSGKTWLSYILTTLVPSIFNEYQFSWIHCSVHQ